MHEKASQDCPFHSPLPSYHSCISAEATGPIGIQQQADENIKAAQLHAQTLEFNLTATDSGVDVRQGLPEQPRNSWERLRRV